MLKIKLSKRNVLIILGILLVVFLVFNLRTIISIFYLRKAKVICDKNPSQKCVDEIIKAKKISPNVSYIRWVLANEYKKMGRIDEAIEEYLWLVQKNPKYTSAYHNLGSLYGRKKDYKTAVTYYEKALEIDPQYYFSLAGLGYSAHKMGDNEKAEAYFRKAIHLKQDYEYAYVYLAQILNVTERHQEARAILESFLSHSKPKDVDFYNHAAFAAIGTNDFEGWKMYVKKGLELSPMDYHLNFSMALEDAEDKDLTSAKRRLDFLKGVDRNSLSNFERDLDLDRIEQALAANS